MKFQRINLTLLYIKAHSLNLIIVIFNTANKIIINEMIVIAPYQRVVLITLVERRGSVVNI